MRGPRFLFALLLSSLAVMTGSPARSQAEKLFQSIVIFLNAISANSECNIPINSVAPLQGSIRLQKGLL